MCTVFAIFHPREGEATGCTHFLTRDSTKPPAVRETVKSKKLYLEPYKNCKIGVFLRNFFLGAH